MIGAKKMPMWALLLLCAVLGGTVAIFKDGEGWWIGFFPLLWRWARDALDNWDEKKRRKLREEEDRRQDEEIKKWETEERRHREILEAIRRERGV